MYGFNSVLIAIVLFSLILIAGEFGHRAGRRSAAKNDAEAKAQTNALQASTLGLLALLLGFTFSMALQRHDSRSEAALAEANAIGTAILRIDLLPDRVQPEMRALFDEYVALRVEAVKVNLTDTDARREVRSRTAALHARLWAATLSASDTEPRPATINLFIQSLNDVIDAWGRRDAALKRHVPEVVLLLLFASFIVAAAMHGYATGIAGARPVAAAMAMSALLVLVIFIVIDLDRPRRGLIQVNQDSMYDLAAGLDARRH